MKKFAIALAAVATGFAATADVSSANVVGYMGKNTVADDNHYFVHTFAAVGGSTSAVPLGSIVPDSNWDADNGDWLGTVDSSGGQDDIYTYCTAAQAALIPNCANPVAGWYALDDGWMPTGETVNSTTIALNGGLVVYSLGGATLNLSGQVISGDTELATTSDDNSYTGNITPSTIKIGDIVPDANWDADNGDWLGTVDSSGGQDDIYTYCTAAQAALISDCLNPVAGWYALDDGWMPAGETVNTTVSLEAGQSLVVYTLAGATLTVPSPIPAE